MINKLVANIKKDKRTNRSRTGSDVGLRSGSGGKQRHSLSAERPLKGRQKQSGRFNKEIVDKTYDLIPAVKTTDRHVRADSEYRD